MKITNERLIEILKDNWYISDILEYHALNVTFNTPVEDKSASDRYIVTMNVKIEDGYEDIYQSSIDFYVDASRYDEKFTDVDTYEVEDFGVDIGIWDITGDGDLDFSLENIWMILFFNKEKLS